MSTDRNIVSERRRICAILIVGTCVVLISLFFGLGSLSRFQDAEAAWKVHNAHATTVANALADFNRHTGYGGFIHNFKNLVLRRDLPHYQEKIEANIAGFRSHLDQLDTLINAPEEEAAIAQIRTTFEEYATNYTKVISMIAAGASSDEIDAVVRVDDGPALKAQAQLKTHVAARARQAEQLAESTHADALRLAWIGGGLMIAAMIAATMAIVAMLMFQNRIVAANEIIRKTQEDLAERERQLLETQRIANLGGWKVDLPSGRLSWTVETFRIFGLSVTEQPSAEQAISYFLPESRKLYEPALNAAIENGKPFNLELQIRTARGDIRWVCAQGEGKHEGVGPHVVFGTLQDITERKQTEDQIFRLASFDALTGLPNRRMLDDHLAQAMAISKRSGLYGALMFMDLDNFKPLNDTHGHGVGDLLMIEVAMRLSACVREVDTVARLGGDEFVVVLSELAVDKAKSTEQAEHVAEKIRTRLAAPYQLTVTQAGGQSATVEHLCTTSIGLAMFMGDEVSQADIMKWADMTMYKAKEAGRNRVLLYRPTQR